MTKQVSSAAVLAALASSIFCVLSAAPQQPAAKPPSPQGPAPAASQDYSKEPYVIEQFHQAVRFENDGTGTRDLKVRVRVQSDAGVRQLGELLFEYNAASEQLEIPFVRVRQADGSVVLAAPDAIKDMTAALARQAPVYTDTREKHVTVPALRPGETLEYETLTRIEHPLAPNQFWFERDFIKDAIVLEEQLEINLPRGRAVKLKTLPGSEPAARDDGDRRIYRWTSSYLKRETGEEAKKKKPAEPLPPAVQLSTFASWEDVGRWYAGLERDRTAPSPEIRARVEELERGRATDLDRIRSIYDFVSTNFRYVSLSFGRGRYQPHNAAEVFANQYGDCKDKHTLLAAMLAVAGHPAAAALIHSSRKLDPDVPSPAQFDHVISAVPLDNDWVWLDTTPEIAPFRFLIVSLRDKQALLIPPDGAARLVKTPADPPFPDDERVEVNAKLSELGKLTAHVHCIVRGDTEIAFRTAFRRTNQSQWNQLGQVLAAGMGLPGTVTELKASDPAAIEQPFEVEFDVEHPNHFDWTTKNAELAMPMPPLGLPGASEEAVEPIRLMRHHTDILLKLELPKSITAPAPVGVAVTRDYGEYRSQYKSEAGVLTAERDLRFQVRELPPDRSPDLAAFLNAVRTDESQSVEVETASGGPPSIPSGASAEELNDAGYAALENGNFGTAAVLLQRVVELEPKHKLAWNNLGRAYTGLGKWNEAMAAFRKQLEVNPYDPYANFNLGLVAARRYKYDEAIGYFQKQLEVNPLDREAHAWLGSVYVEQHRYAEAVPALEKAITLNPNNANLKVQLGRACLNVGQTEKGLAAFDKAVQQAPGPSVWNDEAYVLAEHNLQLDRARSYAESAVATTAAALRNVDLDHPTVQQVRVTAALAAFWDTLGWVYFKQGDLDRAEKFIRAAWELDERCEVGDHLGQIREKRGDKEGAVHAYVLALAASRPIPETRAHLAALLGGKTKDEDIDRRISRAGAELSQMRTIPLGRLLDESAHAELLVLLSPGPKVDAVKFISGDEKLRPLADKLREAHFPVSFPDAEAAKLIRRGVLSCSSLAHACEFVLFPASDVISVDGDTAPPRAPAP